MGILVVSYGARAAAMIDAFQRSNQYETDLYVADKQRNPFNLREAKEHVVIPDLDVHSILKFTRKRKTKIHFVIVGPEKPVINGIRDIIEEETGIPVISPTKRKAIEGSKVLQRNLFAHACPEANPRYRIFDREEYKTVALARRAVFSWLKILKNQAVVKPDAPAAGKGVGVWGDHFTTKDELFDHFLVNFRYGKVIIEEKLEGEESSFQAFCDGKTVAPLPDTRDYKRAFDGDRGPNTGGMGSYKNRDVILPFMTVEDREKEADYVNRIFRKLSAKGGKEEIRGIPFYIAFIHTPKGVKILENNSRPGDPEIINILPLLKDDFVDLCFRMIEGNLKKVEVEPAASVVTYKVPPSYGGYSTDFPEKVMREEVNKSVNLDKAYKLRERMGNNLRVYPAAMELRGRAIYPLTSRAVAVLGIGESIEEARQISEQGIEAIEGGALWSRRDIASPQNINQSVKHMEEIRLKRG